MGWRNNVDPVIEGKLYIGNLIAAVTPQALLDRRITHIVSACTDAIPAHHPASGFHTYRIPVEDDNSSNMLIHLPAVCNFIHHAITHGGVVLVHCVQGLSRSACVVAAYLMWTSRLSATDALSVVRRAREQIWLNPSLHEQLVLFELCGYAPSETNGIYRNWRRKLDQYHYPGSSSGSSFSGSGSGSSPA